MSNNFYESLNHDSKRKVSPHLSFITFLNCFGEKMFSIQNIITKNSSSISRRWRMVGIFSAFFLPFPQRENIVFIVLLDYIYQEILIETMYFIIQNWNRTIICKYLCCLKKEAKIRIWLILYIVKLLYIGKLWQSICEFFFNIENVVSGK